MAVEALIMREIPRGVCFNAHALVVTCAADATAE
jgi:hypothetical protein